MSTQNPYAPPSAHVEDIADPGATVELATRPQRLAAALVDLLTGVVVYLPVIIAAVLHWDSKAAWYMNFASHPDAFAISGILGLVLLIVTIVFVARYGQTIGKRVIGIRVARPNGEKAGFGRIFWLRNVVNNLLGGFLGALLGGVLGGMHITGSFTLLAGYVYPLVDTLMIFGESHQCLHDKIANTIVVKA